jgi:glycosyltransferase involved in cell wall biosynthesis
LRQSVVLLASYAPSLISFRGPLLGALKQRDYDVIAAGPPCAATQAALEALGVRYEPVVGMRTSTNPIGDVAYLLRLARLLRRTRPKALISYTAKPVIWGSLAASLVAIENRFAIITGVGSILMRSRRTLLGSVLQGLYRTSLRTCQRVAFQNPDDRGEFIAQGLVPAERTFQVNGSGVQLDHYQPAALPSQPVFLLIARLLADKGIREYAVAARQLKARHPQARFRLAGWFDENPTALSRAEVDGWVQAGFIEYAGRLQDVRPEIAAAQVYVLPSYREGTPRTVLEAMAMGRAIVTTDTPGCRETVKNEWNGLLVEPRDAEGLAAAMERFIVDPALAATMGQRSRELAVEKYDANKVANDLLTGFGL